MKKSYLIASLLLLSFFTKSYSQAPNKINLKGIVSDTTAEKMAFAYVMLLNPTDSTMLNYTRADEKGAFEFKNLKNGKYILKVSYINYLPLSMPIGPFSEENTDLGQIKIKPISKELMEVVVRTARAPLTIRGDTIEYDARSFKVPEGSTVEDLLRRLPGLEVDAAGNIKAQGQDVRKVLVDGKTFFGDDPKAATKNLGAETISKVQVYNDKSEQAKLTGIDDGKKEKAINLELKDEFKKGHFGKATIAAGDQNRWATKGNLNKFNKNEQFSILGYGNNINETGVNWDDYGEFKGNSQYNFDNGDFGFNGGLNYYFGDNNGITSRFDGRGFTKNAGAGVNYNFDNKKTKISSSYFYNQTELDLNTITNTETFLPVGSFFSKDTTDRVNFLGNHSIGIRFEKMIDSSNTIIAKTNIRLGTNNNVSNNVQALLNGNNVLDNLLNLNSNLASTTQKISSTFIYRLKFKKNKARNFSISAAYNMANNDGNQTFTNRYQYFTASSLEEKIRTSNLLNINSIKGDQYKSSLSFLEPISKKVFWESFYNFSLDKNTTNQINQNILESNKRVDSLSSYFENSILYNRLGTSFRYSYNGINVSAGLAGVQFDLSGNLFQSKGENNKANINKTYSGLTPNITLLYEKNGFFTNLEYSYNFSAPSINDLQPIVNYSNPNYIARGNPNLSPIRSHQISTYFNKFYQASFAYFYGNISYDYYTSQIGYAIKNNSNFITESITQNFSGGDQVNVYVGSSFPIIKTKVNLNSNINYTISKTPNIINDIKNINNTNRGGIRINLNITATSKFFMDLGTNFGITNTKYSLQSALNQRIKNNNYTGSIKWNFAKKTFFESNYNHNIFKNTTNGFNLNQPIWNTSIRRLLLKDNKMEMRLAAFDLLNKNKGIRQNTALNFVNNEISPTLARYFMFSISYNLRGYEDKLKKNNGF